MNTPETFETIFNDTILTWIYNHKQLKDAVADPERLIAYKGKQSIDVSLQFFEGSYYSKHIGADIEKYCLKLLKSLEKPMFQILSKYPPKEYQFHYTFHYYGHFVSKTVTYYQLTRVQ